MIYSTSSGRRSNQVQQGAVNVPNNVPSVTAQQARKLGIAACTTACGIAACAYPGRESATSMRIKLT